MVQKSPVTITETITSWITPGLTHCQVLCCLRRQLGASGGSEG